MFHAARKHASHVVFVLGSLVNKRGDDLIISPSRVYLLWSPSFAKRSATAVAKWTVGLRGHQPRDHKPVSLFWEGKGIKTQFYPSYAPTYCRGHV